MQEFDTLCQVQSDKATVDITSRYAGTITQLGAHVGDFCQVGEPLLYLTTTTTTTTTTTNTAGASSGRHAARHEDEHDTDAKQESTTTPSDATGTNFSSSSSSSSLSAPKSTPSLADQMAADAATNRHEERLRIPTLATHYTLEGEHDDGHQPHKVLTSPAVRKIAAEHHLDLATLHGTGPQGRILKQDVLQYIRQQQPTTRTSTPTETTPTQVAHKLSPPQSDTANHDDEIVQLKGYSRYMVHTMTAALQIPHMTLGDEVVLDAVLRLRQQWKQDHDTDVSVLAFLLKACSLALLEYPLLNASIHDLDSCQLQVHRHHHLGVAMDTPRGLVVPAVQNVQAKSLLEIQHELNRLKEQAKSANGVDSTVLNPTFTLSNIGALGVGNTMSAVLAAPQVAMGALGRLQRVPRFVSADSLDVQAVQVAQVSWTADHRFLDGATLARFHLRFAAFLQDPTKMLWHCK